MCTCAMTLFQVKSQTLDCSHVLYPLGIHRGLKIDMETTYLTFIVCLFCGEIKFCNFMLLFSMFALKLTSICILFEEDYEWLALTDTSWHRGWSDRMFLNSINNSFWIWIRIPLLVRIWFPPPPFRWYQWTNLSYQIRWYQLHWPIRFL